MGSWCFIALLVWWRGLGSYCAQSLPQIKLRGPEAETTQSYLGTTVTGTRDHHIRSLGSSARVELRSEWSARDSQAPPSSLPKFFSQSWTEEWVLARDSTTSVADLPAVSSCESKIPKFVFEKLCICQKIRQICQSSLSLEKLCNCQKKDGFWTLYGDLLSARDKTSAVWQVFSISRPGVSGGETEDTSMWRRFSRGINK